MSRETTENVIIIFSGRGPAINKAITVAEIVKRRLNGSLHQYTQIGRNFLTQENEEKDNNDDEMILDREDQKKQDRQV
jgi:DNA-binding protein